MQHSFDIDLAKNYGIIEAILLNNFQFWIEKNKANGTNFYDGYYWTFNSTKAFAELFPYLTQRQIQNALKNLRDKGILKVGNYNKSKYDRTLWYAFTYKGECIMQKCKMDNTKKVNQCDENVQPIPDNKKQIKKSDNNIYISEFENLWKEYPRKQGKDKALKAYVKYRLNGGDAEKVKQGIERYKRYIEVNKIEQRYIKHGSTWFAGQCWDDEYEETKEVRKNNASYDIDELEKIK